MYYIYFNCWIKILLINVYEFSGGCFTFWYHMYGNTINTLNVYINTNGLRTLLWSTFGNQGNYWQSASLNITGSNYWSQFIFEGLAGASYTGDIAIDDISFSSLCNTESGKYNCLLLFVSLLRLYVGFYCFPFTYIICKYILIIVVMVVKNYPWNFWLEVTGYMHLSCTLFIRLNEVTLNTP